MKGKIKKPEAEISENHLGSKIISGAPKVSLPGFGQMEIYSSLLIFVLCLTMASSTPAQTGSPPTMPVAIIDQGIKITQSEVDAQIKSELAALEERIYFLRLASLNNLINTYILREEASRSHLSIDELRNRLLPASIKVPEENIARIYQNGKSSFLGMSEEEATQRIRLDLEAKEKINVYKKLLADLRRKYEVDILLPQPSSLKIDVSDEGPSKGNLKAPIKIIVYSDFECPYCKQSAKTLPQLVKKYDRQVRLIYKYFPLPIHSRALSAAKAAVCAESQGKFWELYESLFDTDDLSLENIFAIAKRLNLQQENFSNCLSSPATTAIIQKDITEAINAGINATPTIIINGQVIKGVQDFEGLAAVIEQELKKAPSK